MSGHLITIFGGSGFIGRHLVGRLASKGYQIRLAVRDPESAAQLMTQGVVGQIAGVKTNVRDQQSVERAVAGAEIVINLVGILYEKGAQNFGRLHVDAAERIAAAAKSAGAKQLIHMSALGAEKNHESAYARSKAVGEELAAKEFPGATILRPSVVFGLDDDFFNRFASILSLAPVFPLADGGKMKMQPVWVEDLADAIVRIIETPAQQGKTWELTGPDVYSFKELLEKVLTFTGRKCVLMPVPSGAMSIMACVMALAPGRPQLTPDQVKLLKHDNVASGEFPNLQDLGIQPATVDAVVPEYLRRYRRGGAPL
ncbi:complex I NDUFA9 subunit family protein [uncultured Sneathiella sp.]|uniref:complex I NDUFA9 subunit family protein n=1 Tax=uncultured Sneathiella sp. TaxID=879315 RepID=UPI00259607D7|nr:complex I NDUFA9 subunit family protein [uncultured Sneathiella sp.]